MTTPATDDELAEFSDIAHSRNGWVGDSLSNSEVQRLLARLDQEIEARKALVETIEDALALMLTGKRADNLSAWAKLSAAAPKPAKGDKP